MIAPSPTRCPRCLHGVLVPSSSPDLQAVCLLCARPAEPPAPTPDYMRLLASVSPPVCACGCGRPVVAPKRVWAGSRCRIREWRSRLRLAKLEAGQP